MRCVWGFVAPGFLDPCERAAGGSPAQRLQLAHHIYERALFLPRSVQRKHPITEQNLRPIAAELDRFVRILTSRWRCYGGVARSSSRFPHHGMPRLSLVWR